MTSAPYALEAVDVIKRFEGVHALNRARLDVRPGEIHALLGENGAGKSTLIKILTGLHAPDSGTIRVAGADIEFGNVAQAKQAGVVALYQELSIIPTISVAENIVLGEHLPARRGIVRWKDVRRQARTQLEILNENIPLGRLGADLSPVQQTMVAFARALATDARVLILDEPTASLTDTEIVDVFAVLRSLRDRGVAIVYVSHRLEEVFELCDRLTIMRSGETTVTKDVADSHVDEVISLMVGRSASELFPPRATAVADTALTAEGLSGHKVRDVSLSVRAGEVLGIGGLAGAGRSELLRILAGAQRHTTGSITVGDRTLPASPGVERALEAGVALVPEERRSQGVMLKAFHPGQHRHRQPGSGQLFGSGRRWPGRRAGQARHRRVAEQGPQLPPARRRTLRWQSAKGRLGQDARPDTARVAHGRAHARDRRRDEGRDLSVDPPARRGRHGHRRRQLRTARTHWDERPHHDPPRGLGLRRNRGRGRGRRNPARLLLRKVRGTP